MLEFLSLSLTNVSLYDGLELDLSKDGDKDTVLIRGANAQGKTSLFRALTWTVFGLGALKAMEPGDPDYPLNSLRHIDHDGTQEHVGQLEFLSNSHRYRLRRVATSNGSGTISDYMRLQRYDDAAPGDPWKPADNSSDDIRDHYFPPHLAPYLFVNDDRVTGDGSTSTRQITRAIDDMLGVTAVKKAAERAHEARRDLNTAYKKQAGADDLDDTLSEQITSLTMKLEGSTDRQEKLTSQIAARAVKIKEVEGEIDKFESQAENTQLFDERDETAKEAKELATAVLDATNKVRESFSTSALLLPMFHQQLKTAADRLAELKASGAIPQSELKLLRKLLDPESNPKQECVCEQVSVEVGTPARVILERKVAESEGFEADADRLDLVRHDLDALLADQNVSDGWWKEFTEQQKKVTAARRAHDTAVETAARAKKAAEAADAGSAEATAKLNSLRTDLKNLNKQHGNDRTNLDVVSHQIGGGTDQHGTEHGVGLESRLDSANRQLRKHRDALRDAKPLDYAVRAADTMKATLGRIVDIIHDGQVPQVSADMNKMFLAITQNGAASDDLANPKGEEGDDGEVASGAVSIEKVQAGEFELLAETKSGKPKPLSLLNGASQRALTVSFMVTLLEHSGAPIPMVTDSLFHTVSGDVRVGLAHKLMSPPVQKIIFYTPDDAVHPIMQSTLLEKAAHTYTVTNSDLGKTTYPPEPADGAIAMVCRCGPAEQCRTCDLDDPTTDNLTTVEESRVL